MKTFIVITFFAFSALTTVAQEEETLILGNTDLIDDVNDVNIELDLTGKVLSAKSKNGKQFIATVKQISLYVHVQNGKAVNYSASNLRGKQLKVAQTKAFQSCQLCVEDQAGGTVCWRIDCSELPRPVEEKSTH